MKDQEFNNMGFRIGFGFDVHQLAEGEEFWLGGILLDHYKGAVGHSDADVLIHAICDALLGAERTSRVKDFSNVDTCFGHQTIFSREVAIDFLRRSRR